MSKRSRYRWQNLRVDEAGRTIKSDPKKDRAQNTTSVRETRTEPGWRAITAKHAGFCACGCGESIKPGTRVLWHAGHRQVRLPTHLAPPPPRPGKSPDRSE